MERHLDLKIIPTEDLQSGKFCRYDLDLKAANNENIEDVILVNKEEALKNAIILSILTHYKELDQLPPYEDFGCKIHELIKQPATELVRFKLKQYAMEVLEKMDRIKSVERIDVKECGVGVYQIHVDVIDITHEEVNLRFDYA